MVPDPAPRWIVIGKRGSGKSTLAERVGEDLHLPVFDLGLVHWLLNGGKRDEADFRARVAELAAGTDWVMEGVYGWLAQAGLARATTLIWLDLSWEGCRDGLLARDCDVA